MAVIIEQRTRETIDDVWSDWVESTDAAPHEDTDLLEYRVQQTIDYIPEYIEVYEDLLAQAMTSVTAGKDSILEKLFSEIDAAKDNGDITVIEQLSIKKNAYLQLLPSLTAQSQKTAMALVDKRHKFDSELSQLSNQLLLQDEQLNGAVADKDYKIASKEALIDQVTQNRLIKALNAVAEVNGMALGGGTSVGATQLAQFNDLVYELAPEIV